jgi:hypothetical protein
MITKFARLEFELFTKPSKSDFLRVYQSLGAFTVRETGHSCRTRTTISFFIRISNKSKIKLLFQ